MKKIISDKLPRILNKKKEISKELDIKITNRGKEIYIEGDAEQEYIGEKVIDAMNLGFDAEEALLLKNPEFIFEVINIKDHTKSKNLERVRGRVIGTKGKSLKTLSTLTNCYFEIKENEVGIIGHADAIQAATQALISLIQGSKHSNVYSYLEKHQPEAIPDLNLKK